MNSENVDFWQGNLSTNDKPGTTDLHWNKFLNDKTDRTDLGVLGDYDHHILHNNALLSGEKYDGDAPNKEIKPNWNITGGVFLDQGNGNYINTPNINAKKGLFGSFNSVHSLYNEKSPTYYSKNIITHKYTTGPGKYDSSDITSYNLNNFKYNNYSSKNKYTSINRLDLTPSYIGHDDYGYQISKGIYESQSKLFINNILNDFLHIWYFDTWVKEYASDFDNNDYYNLALYNKLENKLDRDLNNYGWLNKLYFHLSISYNYLKQIEKKAKIPEWASILTGAAGGFVDTFVKAVPGLGWMGAALLDMLFYNLNHQRTTIGEENSIYYNSSDYLDLGHMSYIFDDLLGTPEEFKSGDYSKPIAAFENNYHHFPSQINLNNFNIYLNINKFINKVESNFQTTATTDYHGWIIPGPNQESFIDAFNPSNLIPNLTLNISMSRDLGYIGKIFSALNKYFSNINHYILAIFNSKNPNDPNNQLLSLIYSRIPEEDVPGISKLKNFKNKITFSGTLPTGSDKKLYIIKMIYDNKIIANIRVGEE